MPLAKRIIPCLDVDGGKVVKGIRFRALKNAGDPVELSLAYREGGADEIVFLDITATTMNRKTITELVKRVAMRLDIPFTVGGGIRDAEDVDAVLAAGADKVSINTAAVQRPALIEELSDIYGAQCIVVAIDAKREGSGYEVYTHAGSTRTGLSAGEWARDAERLGAGELLVTSIDRDGTRLGYDLELLRDLTSRVNIPVIASGGCGTLEHFREALTDGRCDAALAASLFHTGELQVSQVKEYLAANGVVVRP